MISLAYSAKSPSPTLTKSKDQKESVKVEIAFCVVYLWVKVNSLGILLNEKGTEEKASQSKA